MEAVEGGQAEGMGVGVGEERWEQWMTFGALSVRAVDEVEGWHDGG